jgi:RNA polymerase sigma-70 factor (ECF subfamily)
MDESERAVQVRLAAKGDADASQRLIVSYHAPLRRLLEGEIDKRLRRHVDPDDVLQEAYIAAFKAVAACKFDGPGGFYKWLERIALNQLKDAQRNLRRKKRAVVRDRSAPPATATSYPDLIARLSSPDSTPSRHVAKAEATAAVMSSLARLTDDQRRAIRMRFLEGCSRRPPSGAMS